MSKKASRGKRRAGRRTYSDELKAEAVQMLLDGHSAESVASNLGLSGANLLYRWKAKLLQESGAAATTLENRVRQLEEELRRVERERDVLQKSLGHFQPEDVSELYAVIDQLEKESFAVCLLCKTLNVSRSAYYLTPEAFEALTR
jgi:transposase-like protein